MFNNIGKTIKKVAKIVALVNMILSITIGLIIVIAGVRENSGDGLILVGIGGFFVAMIGSFSSWGAFLFMYGFGHLIENSDLLVENTKKEKTNEMVYNNQTVEVDKKCKEDALEKEKPSCADNKAMSPNHVLFGIVFGMVFVMILFVLYAFLR